MVTATIQNLGHWALSLFERMGRASIFFVRVLVAVRAHSHDRG